MLRLSKKADYALIAITHLTLKSGSSSAREIAEQFDIPVELLAKVLQRLTRRGLLASQQGTRGGYQLARAATGISIADVIQAIDGPVAVTACSAHADRWPVCQVQRAGPAVEDSRNHRVGVESDDCVGAGERRCCTGGRGSAGPDAGSGQSFVSPSIHEFGDEPIPSGLSAERVG